MKKKVPKLHEKPVVKFDRPLPVGIMTIDGTRCMDSRLIDISDSGGQVEIAGHALDLTEFFLMLTTFGNPVFRRCKREWVQGAIPGGDLGLVVRAQWCYAPRRDGAAMFDQYSRETEAIPPRRTL